MQLQSENTCDQSQHSSTNGTEDLKNKITLTNSQLHQIVINPQSFSLRIKQLNRKAIKEINQEAYEDAMIYLSEAEKNLQYAASCGLSIDRVLITTTLKNQACAYQRLWELATCYDYMEALIYNLNVKLDDAQQLCQSEDIKDQKSQTSKKLQKILNQKLTVGLCYLQFSALSSQLGKHQQAQKLVERSLSQFTELIKSCRAYEKCVKGKTSQYLDKLLIAVEYNSGAKIERSLKQVKNSLDRILSHRYFFSFDPKIIECLSMGDIMQIEPLSFDQAFKQIPIDWFISQLGLIYISIYLSCCFFALATEIRLGSQKQVSGEQQVLQRLSTAKAYHLHSIKLSSQLVLIQSNFLTHIIKSFKNNFGIDIINEHLDDAVVHEISRKMEYKKLDLQKVCKDSETNTQSISQKQDQDRTKNQNTDSDANSNNDRKTIDNIKENNKKQNGRKFSTTEHIVSPGSRSSKIMKNLISPAKGINLPKQARSRDKSKGVTNRKKSVNNIDKVKSIKKQKINQYFLNVEHGNKHNNGSKQVTSPRNKLTRKQQSSRSRPKLKLKSFKSPTNF